FYLLNRYVIRYRYDVVRSNLRNAFPERSEGEINTLTEQTFRNLADLLVETIKGIGISRDELDRRMAITASSRVHELVNQGKPLIFLTAHYCNWEWLLLYSCMHLPHPLMVAYQPFHDQRFDEFMLEARTRFGGELVPATDLIRQIIKHRKTLKTLTLLADQSPMRSERKYWTTFLNQDTAFIDGTDSLAWLTRMPVIFVSTKRRKRGHYDVSLDVIAEPPYEKNAHTVVERYARELEAMIQADPSAWLWSHRRWKFSRSDVDC
ncbi:MAG: lysophospholipid acyltransferase family protein, partial [Gammaproteobacteria bacterium]|nr:lysophospholipid acyltransferase family protein [Gammaproteobacteria bacterium]